MRKGNLIPAILSVSLSVFFSCEKTVDLGPVEYREFRMEAFSGVRVNSLGKVYLRTANDFRVEIETHQSIMDQFDLNTSGDDLTIRLRLNQLETRSLERLNIYVYAPSYSSIVLDDVAEIIGEDEIKGRRLDVTLNDVGDIALYDVNVRELRILQNDVGNIELYGDAEYASYELDDVGNIRAFGLRSRYCRAMLEGVGDIELLCTDELEATIKGVGDIIYKGNPSVRSDIRGEGKLIHSD